MGKKRVDESDRRYGPLQAIEFLSDSQEGVEADVAIGTRVSYQRAGSK